MPDFSDFVRRAVLKRQPRHKAVCCCFVVTVEAIEVEEGKKPKPVLFLEGVDRGVVVNKTRYDAMSDITGSPDTGNWCGRQVLVKRGSTNYAGKKVACVELEAAPASTGAALDDAIPF